MLEKNYKIIKASDLDNQKVDSFMELCFNKNKVDFLKNRVMTRETVYRLLHQYVYKSKTNWYDLKKNKQYVKNLIRHKLAKSLRQLSN